MREYLISIWSLLDPLYYHCSNLTYLSSKGEGNIFRVKLTIYKGRDLVLSDGTQINKNDLLVKIHLHNVRLLKELKQINSGIKKAKIVYNYVQKSLPGIETYIRNHPQSSKIKGIIGITSLNKGSERLGFEIFDISHPLYKWFKIIAFMPIEILSCNHSSVMQILKQHQPRYLFMSTKKLSNMYRQ